MNTRANRTVRTLLLTLTLCLAVTSSWAAEKLNPAILVIGASYENAQSPFNDSLEAPVGGVAVNLGSYLSLGNGLARTQFLDGFVINEAQAGATSFDRLSCTSGQACGPAGWQGFDKQFTKALARVTVRNPADPAQVLSCNADYVLIGLANDCLHSDAFGVHQDQTASCTTSELNAYADRIISTGRTALSKGITPIYYQMPAYDDLNLPLMLSLYGLRWIVDEREYNTMRTLIWSRLKHELPQALLVKAWENFTHIGDGLHPSPRTVEIAAHRIALAIRHDRMQKRH